METRRTSVVLALVQATLLVLSAASLLVFASWVLGHNGLGLVSGDTMHQQESASNAALSEPVVVSGRAGVATVGAAQQVIGGLSGREILTGDGSSEFFGNESNLTFLAPTRSQHAAWVAVRALPPLGLAAIWWLLFGIVRSVGRGNGFTKPVARRIRAIGVLVLVGMPLVQIGRWAAARWLVDTSNAARIADVPDFQLDLWPFAVGLVIVVMAAAWSEAARMREDLEALV